jgi:homoserine O-acetyltransferase
MGGMNAWQWAERYPDAVGGIMPVVALPAKISGRNLLWRRMAVRAIESDPAWKDGNYAEQPRGLLEAISLVRLMIDGVPRFQRNIPDEVAADKFIAVSTSDHNEARCQRLSVLAQIVPRLRC